MKTSRDLMLLAAVAYKNGKFDDAGALFAASLSASDADEMLQTLNCLDNPDAEVLEIESVSSSSDMSLSAIVESISAAIGEHHAATASDEDEDSEEEDEDLDDEDSEEEDEEEEDEEEDEDDESLSTSSAAPQSKGEPTFILQGSSPIKLKQN